MNSGNKFNSNNEISEKENKLQSAQGIINPNENLLRDINEKKKRKTINEIKKCKLLRR